MNRILFVKFNLAIFWTSFLKSDELFTHVFPPFFINIVKKWWMCLICVTGGNRIGLKAEMWIQLLKFSLPVWRVTTIYHCICPTQNSSDSVYFFIFCFLHKLSSVILYPTRIRILPHVQCFVPRKACPLLENTGASMYIQWPMVVFYLFFSLSQSSVVNSLWL